eukprot:TRINITY_DN8220_c0_g1_i3.p1 TRINITY_DN8220_c0_g1~~TRINITY_DN8220_c0_g1_i3.p1  ORF type:complete len:412 (+),score=53.05 TRINITY_DN8220_c0_g1_i3:59-1294(+)
MFLFGLSCIATSIVRLPVLSIFFFFNDTATTEIYTLHIVGSVRCVQETGTWGYIQILYTHIFLLIQGQNKLYNHFTTMDKSKQSQARPDLKKIEEYYQKSSDQKKSYKNKEFQMDVQELVKFNDLQEKEKILREQQLQNPETESSPQQERKNIKSHDEDSNHSGSNEDLDKDNITLIKINDSNQLSLQLEIQTRLQNKRIELFYILISLIYHILFAIILIQITASLEDASSSSYSQFQDFLSIQNDYTKIQINYRISYYSIKFNQSFWGNIKFLYWEYYFLQVNYYILAGFLVLLLFSVKRYSLQHFILLKVPKILFWNTLETMLLVLIQLFTFPFQQSFEYYKSVISELSDSSLQLETYTRTRFVTSITLLYALIFIGYTISMMLFYLIKRRFLIWNKPSKGTILTSEPK